MYVVHDQTWIRRRISRNRGSRGVLWHNESVKVSVMETKLLPGERRLRRGSELCSTILCETGRVWHVTSTKDRHDRLKTVKKNITRSDDVWVFGTNVLVTFRTTEKGKKNPSVDESSFVMSTDSAVNVTSRVAFYHLLSLVTGRDVAICTWV